MTAYRECDLPTCDVRCPAVMGEEPHGWLSITEAVAWGQGVEWEFCSWEHVADYAAARAARKEEREK